MLLLPGILAIVLFLFFPLVQTIWPTVGGGAGVSKYLAFLQNSYNLGVLRRTLLIAVITTVLALAPGLPLALWLARRTSAVRGGSAERRVWKAGRSRCGPSH